MAQEPHRCGTIAILGRPNVGKSTLLNRFLGEKIAVVTHKPETTRDRLLGILTLEGAQILFLDTPGIYSGAKTLLAKHQIRAARDALSEAEVLVVMTEAQAGLTKLDRQIIQSLPKPPPSLRGGKKQTCEGVPAFLVINKVDRVERALILPQIDEAGRLYPFKEIFPTSALQGDNVQALLDSLAQVLPEGPALYPPDQITDKPIRNLAQDLIREKVLLFAHEEVPYAVAVLVEEWRPGQTKSSSRDPDRTSVQGTQPRTYVRATIFVERDSQKGILIGKEGGLLKRIGLAAREEIEKLVAGPVYLDLWVKVAKNWRKDPVMLKRLGYG